jgi:hypothetical protein
MAETVKEPRSLALTPTWSVVVSLLVERLINHLSNVSIA